MSVIPILLDIGVGVTATASETAAPEGISIADAAVSALSRGR